MLAILRGVLLWKNTLLNNVFLLPQHATAKNVTTSVPIKCKAAGTGLCFQARAMQLLTDRCLMIYEGSGP